MLRPLEASEASSYTSEAHLIPKIRCQFAEFLNQGSSTRLRILISPTCVGLRYGQLLISFRGFSRHDSIDDSKRSPKRLLSLSGLGRMYSGFAYYTTYTLRATIPSVTSSNSMRPPITQTIKSRYRNINRFAIVYPFRTRLRSRLTLR